MSQCSLISRSNRKPASSQGFTLLEMLLALAIFALIGMSSWQVLNTVVNARNVQSEHLQKLEAMDYAYMVIKQDIRQIVSRGVRINGKVSKQAIFAGEILDSDDQGLTFVRAGWINPESRLPRSELQRVYYRLYDGQLERGYDRVLDAQPGTEPDYQPLLSGLNSLKFRFYYIDDKQHSGQWQDTLKEDSWPAAIALRMTMQDADTHNIFTDDDDSVIERRILIPGQWSEQNASS
ncbi:type II secretion system minor pseudopilin GspJ [Spongorhabdus nitratireducens]